MKELLVGVQMFGKLIRNNYLYVGNTKDILFLFLSGTFFYTFKQGLNVF